MAKVFLYIDIEGRIGKSVKGPTKMDSEMVTDGELSVLEISVDNYGNICVEEHDPDMDGDNKFFDVGHAVITDNDDGFGEYHLVNN